MPEWLIERGIGETRYALIENGEIIEARIELDGLARAGAILEGRLKSVGPSAVAVHNGQEYLLPGGTRGATEGSRLSIEITRELIPGTEPWKRPLARQVDDGAAPSPQIAGELLPFPAPTDRLGNAGWDDGVDQARSGSVQFSGGELRISPTPAMTLIDVDGHLPPDQLAVRGAEAAAKAIRRLDIGGSIGIDLPTVKGRAARQAAAAAIDAHLPQPFERTAVNGFGFIQVIRPRLRASLVELAQDRTAFEARALLRRAAYERTGAQVLIANPTLIAVLEAHPDWVEQLARAVGGTVALRPKPKLAISDGYVSRA